MKTKLLILAVLIINVFAMTTNGITQVTFIILEDTFVDSAAPDTADGSGNNLRVQSANNRGSKISYLKFNVSSGYDSIETATLSLFSVTSSASVSVYAVDHSNWDENTLTWNDPNRPALGALLDQKVCLENSWCDWDVSSLVTADGVYSVALVSDEIYNDRFRSKDYSGGSLAPKLEVTEYNTTDPTARPNVIFILTDDHGYTDLGIHGIDSHVQTPTMDTLTQGGALITEGYCTAPQCRPSRYGIISGRYQNRDGFRENPDEYMDLGVTTIPERLQALGIRTGMVGKWHLDPKVKTDPAEYPGEYEDYSPGQRGFDDYWYGSQAPYSVNFTLDGQALETPVRFREDPINRIVTQGEAGAAFIEKNKDEQFFLYLSLYGPHTPLIEETDPYYLDFPLLDYPNYSPEVDNMRRRGLALIKAIDDTVATVMEKLREHGLEENTIIFFAGDNGAQPKFRKEIGGQSTLDSWDGSENIPLRGEKGTLWEGGIRVPMWAYWKDHIPAGQIITEPIITMDFMATALVAAGGTVSPELDGVNLIPFLTGSQSALNRQVPLFWDYGNSMAVRKEDWKLLRDGGDREYLFDLYSDPMELFDLRDAYPQIAAELATDLDAWQATLPPEGRSSLTPTSNTNLYHTGAPPRLPIVLS